MSLRAILFLALLLTAGVVVADDRGHGRDEQIEDFGDDEAFADAFADRGDREAAPEPRVVTAEFTNIPIGEAIRYLCQGVDLHYRVEPHAVIVTSDRVAFERFSTRYYDISEAFMALLPEGDDNDPLRAYFETLGLRFDDGAQLQLVRPLRTLVVTQDEAQFRQLEQLLYHLDAVPNFKGDGPCPAVVPRGEIWKKLQLIVPRVAFAEATIGVACRYLTHRSRDLDPDGVGVNIFLQLDEPPRRHGADGDLDDDFEHEERGHGDD